MDLIDALKQLKGNRSLAEFAAETGLSYTLLCNQLNRRMRIGHKTAFRLAKMYPQLQDLIDAYLTTPVVTLHSYPSSATTTVVNQASEQADSDSTSEYMEPQRGASVN